MVFGWVQSDDNDSSFMAQDEEIEVDNDESFLPFHAQEALNMYGSGNNNYPRNGADRAGASSQNSIGSYTAGDTSMFSHDSGYAGDTSYIGDAVDISYAGDGVDSSMEVMPTNQSVSVEPDGTSQSHHKLPTPEEAASLVQEKLLAIQTGDDEDDLVKEELPWSSCWHTRRRLVFSVICLLLVIAAVLIGVVVGLTNGGGSRTEGNAVVVNPHNPNVFPPTAAPIAPSDDQYPHFPSGGQDGTPEPLDPTNYCPLDLEMGGIPITDFNDSVVLYGKVLNTTLIGANNNPNATVALPKCQDISEYGRGLWYTLRGPGAVVRATTCLSLGLSWDGTNTEPLDTILSVFTSQTERCTDGLECVVANDDCPCGKQSAVSWYAEEGRSYYVLVSGKPAASSPNVVESAGADASSVQTVGDRAGDMEYPTGGFVLTLSLAPIGTCDAAIDYKSKAEPLTTLIMDPSQQTQVPTASSIVIGSLLGAKIGPDPCNPGHWLSRGGEIWYSVTGNGGWLMATTCHEGASNQNEFPPRLALYKGQCDELDCGLHKASDLAPSVDRDCGFGYSFNWWSQLGVQYYIMVYKTSFLPGIQFGLTVEDLDPPANSNCTNAIMISPDGTVTYGSTLRATYTPKNVAPPCALQDVQHTHPGVWYKVVGTGKRLTASLCNEVTKFDTKLSIYEGGCGNLTCLIGNDLWCGYQSSADWVSESGTTYYILVHGSTGGTQPSIGDFGLAIYEFLPTANDYCSDAIRVEAGSVTKGSTSTASPDDNVQGCDDGGRSRSNVAPGVWYTVIGTGGGLRAFTCGSGTDYDTRLSVYRGDDCQQLQCLAYDDNGCGFQSSVYWSSNALEVYYILVHGNLFSSFGDFTLTIEKHKSNTINDFCANALPAFTSVMNLGSTKNATNDGVGTCVVPNTAPGTWYTVEGSGAGMVATTCHSVTDFDTRLSVFRGDDCEQLECVGGNDDSPQSEACGSSGGSRVSWLSQLGAKYYILVHGWGALVGTFGLTIDEIVPIVPNDYCITSMNISVTLGNSSNTNSSQQQPVAVGTTVNATVDNVPTCGDVDTNGDGVWYKGVGTGNRLAASTCNWDSDNVDSVYFTFNTMNPGVWTDFNTQISVFRGGCRKLECIGANNDRCGYQSSVNFYVDKGEDFYVLVHGFGGATGSFGLFLEEIFPQVANDFCDTATVLTLPVGGGSNQLIGSTAEASYDTVEKCVVPNTSPGVWYRVTGNGNKITVTTCGHQTNFDTRLSVFTGSCQRLECVTGNDDTGGSCGLASTVSWLSVDSQVYYVRVHGWGSLVGNFQLTISQQAASSS